MWPIIWKISSLFFVNSYSHNFLHCFFSKNIASNLYREIIIEKKTFLKGNHEYLIFSWSGKAFKVPVVNWTCHSQMECHFTSAVNLLLTLDYLKVVDTRSEIQGVPRNMTVARQLTVRYLSLKNAAAFIRKPYFRSNSWVNHKIRLFLPGVCDYCFRDVGWRMNAANNCKDQRRPSSCFSTVMFRGTPCISNSDS